MSATRQIAPQPWMTAAETRAVVEALTRDGGEIRFVGGCVRDAVAGRPVKDVDLATPLPPDEIVRRLDDAGLRAVPTGIAHGTVTAVVASRHFEITTLRIDVETDGRRARVAFTDDWDADAARRDLTINALSCTPDGTVHDPFGGVADLEAGRVRFVGDPEERIREDVLRLLRFFRFHAHFGRGHLDPAGLAACRRLGHLLPTLSGERIQAELLRLLEAPNAADTLERMHEEDILDHVLPEATAFDRLRRLVVLEDHHDVALPPVRRLAAVVNGDRPVLRALADRLRLSNRDRDYLLRVHAALPGFKPIAGAGERHRWFYRHGASDYADLVLLHWAGRETSPAGLGRELADAAAWRRPQFPVDGRDVQALGIRPGPEVGALLTAVEEWWTQHDFEPDRAACLDRLGALARRVRPGEEGGT